MNDYLSSLRRVLNISLLMICLPVDPSTDLEPFGMGPDDKKPCRQDGRGRRLAGSTESVWRPDRRNLKPTVASASSEQDG